MRSSTIHPGHHNHADSATSALRASAIVTYSCSVGAWQSPHRCPHRFGDTSKRNPFPQSQKAQNGLFLRIEQCDLIGLLTQSSRRPKHQTGFPCMRDSPQQRHPHDSLSAVSPCRRSIHVSGGVGEVCHNLATHSQDERCWFSFDLLQPLCPSPRLAFFVLAHLTHTQNTQHRRDREHGLPNPTEDIPTMVTDVWMPARGPLPATA